MSTEEDPDYERALEFLGRAHSFRDGIIAMAKKPISFEISFYEFIVTEIWDAKAGKVWSVKDDEEVVLLKKITPDPYQEGHFVFSFPGNKVTNYYCNPMGSVHGGAIASWVDILTSAAIWAFDIKLSRMRHVSLGLSTEYISGGKVGEGILFKATIMKITKKIAFSRCECYDEKWRLMSTSTHKKMFINHKGKL